MLRNKKFSGLAAMFAAVTLVATACGAGGSGSSGSDSGSGDGGGGKTITIGYITWAENIATSNLTKQVLEEKGYTVELKQLQAGALFAGLSDGQIDLFQDVWLPVTHKDYWARYKENIEDLGVWYDNAKLALTVPSYVKDVNSIADLKTNADLFNGTITGIEPGAGETGVIQKQAIPQYQLDGTMTLKSSSTTAMLSALTSSIEKQEPIVVALWHPHWAYNKWDLKDLKDPKGAMGDAEEIHVAGRKGFTADFPQVAEAMKNFKMNDKQLQSLEKSINDAGDGNEAEGVQNWIKKNQEFVDKYFGSIQAG